MKKYFMFLFLLATIPKVLFGDDIKTIGTSGADYPTLNEAFFDINNGILTGVIILKIIDNTSEFATAELFESGYGGGSSYTSVTIYPTTSGLSISGDFDGPLISLDGATNVTIDGRVNATGSTKDLILTNVNTGSSASTIQFIDDASSNIIKYCIIKGSSTNASGGVIFFSTAGIGSGNDGNTIDLNNITSDAAGRPVNAIYSSGSSGQENSGNIISNNNIYDFLNKGTASNGILLSSNTISFTISGNSFYESASFVPSSAVAYNVIKIDNTSGTGFTITGNYIGGQAAACGGSAWTKTSASNNVFIAISLNVGTGSVSSIQDNTIKNFNWSNSASAAWTGINISGGMVNIGTVTGNTIGASSGTGSITVNATTTNAIVTGINITSIGTVDCQNNIIGSITTSVPSTLACNFTGINKTDAGTVIISNNSIGSTSTSGSINASSASSSNAQIVFGINNTGSGSITISGNTIANLSNSVSGISTSSRGRINGIYTSSGSNTITSNTIHDLTIANANDAPNQIASVCGIALFGVTLKTLTGNFIYNLSNTYSSFTGSVIGLFYVGNTGDNAVTGNFIHNLSVASGSAAFIYGIKVGSGAVTYANNIISLGGSTTTDIYGIYETGTAGNNNSLYFNTVYIGGSVSSGINKSYALYSAVNTNTRDFRNNIFINTRSTTGGSNLHFALYIVSSGGVITSNYNDYYVSGTGGTLGYYGGLKATLPIVDSQDNASFTINPVLANPGGTTAGDYLPSASSLVAVPGTGILTDYSGVTRSVTYPAMGAWEYSVTPSWIWTGLTNTDWNIGTNWNYSSVPVSTNDVVIASATNNPIVNEAPGSPAECKDLTINSGAILTIAAGKALRVNGILTNSAGVSGLIIKSDANGNDGKLINNTPSVPATVELFLSGGAGSLGPIFHYIVPPVESMTIGADIAAAKTNLGITNFVGDLMAYSESAAGATKDMGWQYFDGYTTGGYSYNPFSSLSSAMGYNIRLTAGEKITFKGLLNASAHTYSSLSFTNQGFNLVGNPYPCNYDLSGISALVTTGDGIDNTVYFNNDGGYAVWNVGTGAGTTGYSAIMPPMQGFMVHVNTTGQSLNLPVGSKTPSAALPLRSKGYDASVSKGATLVKKVKLVLSNSIARDETIVCLIDNATPSFDGDYDAYKFFGSSSVPYIYTDMGSVKYAINSVQEPAASTSMTIPVTVVIKNAGTYNIDISEFENLDGVNVVLKHGAIETTLSKSVSYSFTSAAGTFTDFELIIGNNNTQTGIEPLTNEKVKTWYSNRFLYINCPGDLSSDKSRLVIYDIQGKMVYKDNLSLTSGQTIQVPINLPKGLYITHININSQQIVTKIVVL